jgi:hypothetical protein
MSELVPSSESAGQGAGFPTPCSESAIYCGQFGPGEGWSIRIGTGGSVFGTK